MNLLNVNFKDMKTPLLIILSLAAFFFGYWHSKLNSESNQLKREQVIRQHKIDSLQSEINKRDFYIDSQKKCRERLGVKQ